MEARKATSCSKRRFIRVFPSKEVLKKNKEALFRERLLRVFQSAFRASVCCPLRFKGLTV
jgi:hypothetical protein